MIELDRDYIKNVIWRKYRVQQIHYVILKRIFLSNPQLYEIVDGVIIYENRFSMDILSFNENYKDIWDCLREDIEYIKLNEIGYDEHLHCYVIDITSIQILEFIKNVNRMWNENPKMKQRWLELYG